MALGKINQDNQTKLSLAFFSQPTTQNARQQAHPAASGRVRRNKKKLGFKIDNSN